MFPKVSIMIPTYNQEQYILDSISSALNQDYENIEVVISDDNSTDNTYEIIQNLLIDNRVKYFKNKTNIGRSKNYNRTLFNYTTGDWVVNLDGDDYFTDNKFISRAMRQILSSESNVIAYLTNKYVKIKKIKKNILLKNIDNKTCIISGKHYFLNYYKIGGFTHMSFIYDRKTALQIGFYQSSLLSADFISFMMLLLNGNIILSNYNIGIWRVHNKNASLKNYYRNYFEGKIAISTITSYASIYFNNNELTTWLFEALNNNKESLILNLLQKENRFNNLKLILYNFKFKKVYFYLLIKTLLRKS
jgi:glycosyltransferase involved in cell wall biosynthesis